MAQVSVRQARDNLSQLIKDAQAGEDVVISNHGTPVARIVPIGGLTGPALASLIEQLQLPAERARGRAEVDAAIEAERSAWE